MSKIESSDKITSYFAAGTFVDDTIWSVKVASLNISSQPISIAKKSKTHYYLKIFLFTKELSKPSVSKTHFDVQFFVNVVFKKTITDKQFSYLVLADVIVRKSLKLKVCLPHNFFDTALYYLFLYGLKFFEQIQSEEKMASLAVCWIGKLFVIGRGWIYKAVVFVGLSHGLNVLESDELSAVRNNLHKVWFDFFEVYTDSLLRSTGSANVASSTTVYFLVLNISVGIVVYNVIDDYLES
ncbi:hypothetical protein G9A89_021252 [Geosiphon pyriformis]|nr:hypothetical protein G9A89_021252 [Geosiphon pyriformis]